MIIATPRELIIYGILIAIFYEITALCYREKQFRNFLHFGYDYPGWAVGLIFFITGISMWVRRSLFRYS